MEIQSKYSKLINNVASYLGDTSRTVYRSNGTEDSDFFEETTLAIHNVNLRVTGYEEGGAMFAVNFLQFSRSQEVPDAAMVQRWLRNEEASFYPVDQSINALHYSGLPKDVYETVLQDLVEVIDANSCNMLYGYKDSGLDRYVAIVAQTRDYVVVVKISNI